MPIDQRFFRSNVSGFINLPLNGNTTLTLESNISALEPTDSKSYRIVFRADSPSGNIVATSNIITMYGNAFLSIQATGGTKTEEGDWFVHAFEESNVLNISSLSVLSERNTIQYLVVGGGGGGGDSLFPPKMSGGGGAGGLLTGNINVDSTYIGNSNVIVGAGGSGPSSGTDGSPSSLLGVTALGGGGTKGTNRYTVSGIVGSGGGSVTGTYPSNIPGSVGTDGQGYAGGRGSASRSNLTQPVFPNLPYTVESLRRGGGGGSGGAASGLDGQNGGIGTAISWVPESYGVTGPTPGRWFAGGAAGGSWIYRSPSAPSPGTTTNNGTNGVGSNTSGGGSRGGAAANPGIVIIRYPKG